MKVKNQHRSRIERLRRQVGHCDSERRRTGAIIIILMICLLLVSMIGASLLKLALAQRNQARREQWRVQARLLAQSGLERAAAKLEADASYSGEEWTIENDKIKGVVKISVTIDSDTPRRFVVSAVSDYPTGDEQRARVSRKVHVDLK